MMIPPIPDLLPETMSGQEVAWFLCNAVGIVASGMLLIRTWRKRQSVPSIKLAGVSLGIAKRIARRNFRDEGCKMGWHLSGVVIGVWVLTQPPRPGEVEMVSVLAGWLLIAMSGLLAASSVFNLRDDNWISGQLLPPPPPTTPRARHWRWR